MPKTLHARLLLLVIIIVAIPITLAGFFLSVTAETAILAEKEQKLFGAAAVLDKALVGTYHDILVKHNLQTAPKQQQIDALNRELSGITDTIASAYPGIGVGYYSKELDAILTYGPSKTYGNTVGRSISAEHDGRWVMAHGLPRVQEGNLVRGLIMNAMRPVIREDEIIGYIWANELTVDIRQQIGTTNRKIFFLILGALVLGILGVAHVIERLVTDVSRIKAGLLTLRSNSPLTMPPMQGEIGEIATTFNELVRDLAEKRKLEGQVQHAERLAAAGEIAASLAHEIRNPLMAIKGFAQLLKETSSSAESEEYSEIIVKETDRMNHLIEQLLYLARPASGDEGPVDVTAVLENTLLLVDSRARRNHIEIRRSYERHIPVVNADNENMKQVFLNIIINAIQAMDSGGILSAAVTYNPEERTVSISIADTGPGILPENSQRLFDPFFTTKESGTGLGLSVAQQLVRHWGGQITVDSTVGSGSTFTIILPEAGGEQNERENTGC